MHGVTSWLAAQCEVGAAITRAPAKEANLAATPSTQQTHPHLRRWSAQRRSAGRTATGPAVQTPSKAAARSKRGQRVSRLDREGGPMLRQCSVPTLPSSSTLAERCPALSTQTQAGRAATFVT